MNAMPALERLLDSRLLWQGQGLQAPGPGIPTGFAELDAALPLGGWPPAALTELLLPAWGLGELRWLLPTLARLSRAGGRIVLVSPPFIPYAISWQRAGVDLRQLSIVTAGHGADTFWSLEQCLRSACCAAVLGWPEGADHTMLRRLQVAADHGQTPGFLLRHLRHARQPSPAALRLQLQAGGRLSVLKCRGGSVPARPFGLPAADGLSPVLPATPVPDRCPAPAVDAG